MTFGAAPEEKTANVVSATVLSVPIIAGRDKFAKSTHPRSLFRDAAFMQRFRELAITGSVGEEIRCIVCVCVDQDWSAP
jgi:hypothetical protein